MDGFEIYTLVKALAAQLLVPMPLCIGVVVLGFLLRLRWTHG